MRYGLFLLVLAVGIAGCGRDDEKSQTHNVKIDIGGAAYYAGGGPLEGLAGITVTLVDVEGETETATTGSGGLWTASNMHPGAWTETFSGPGYESLSRAFVLEALGDNDIANVFVGRPDALLAETRVRATVTNWGIVLEDGDTKRDGYLGVVAQYSVAADGAIVIQLDQDVIDANADLQDGETGQNIGATFDSAANTLTFSEVAINGMNFGGVGQGITTDADPWTWHRIDIQADTITPIHGDLYQYDSTLYFNAVP